MGGGLDGYSWTEGIGLARLIAVFSNSGITGCTSVIPAIQWRERGGKKNFDKVRDMWRIYIYIYYYTCLKLCNEHLLSFFFLFDSKKGLCFLSYYFCKFFTINYNYTINEWLKSWLDRSLGINIFLEYSIKKKRFFKNLFLPVHPRFTSK